MSILSTAEHLQLVQQAIADLVAGKRKVSVEYTNPGGDKTRMEYSNVSLTELSLLEQRMRLELMPVPLMESIDVEIEF